MSNKTLREAAERAHEWFAAYLNGGAVGDEAKARDCFDSLSVGLRAALADSAESLRCTGCGGDFTDAPPYVFCDECLPVELPGTPPWPKPATADAPEGPWDEKKAGHLLHDVILGRTRRHGGWNKLTDDERLKWIVMARNYRYLNRLDAQQKEER